MIETRNEKDLGVRYVTIKISDLNKYLNEQERNDFWKLFWSIVDRKEC